MSKSNVLFQARVLVQAQQATLRSSLPDDNGNIIQRAGRRCTVIGGTMPLIQVEGTDRSMTPTPVVWKGDEAELPAPGTIMSGVLTLEARDNGTIKVSLDNMVVVQNPEWLKATGLKLGVTRRKMVENAIFDPSAPAGERLIATDATKASSTATVEQPKQ